MDADGKSRDRAAVTARGRARSRAGRAGQAGQAGQARQAGQAGQAGWKEGTGGGRADSKSRDKAAVTPRGRAGSAKGHRTRSSGEQDGGGDGRWHRADGKWTRIARAESKRL